MGEEKHGRNIVKQVLEPVNTTRKGRASSYAKRVLLDPEEYLQALYLRNLSFWNTFLHGYHMHPFHGYYIFPFFKGIARSSFQLTEPPQSNEAAPPTYPSYPCILLLLPFLPTRYIIHRRNTQFCQFGHFAKYLVKAGSNA